MKLYDYLPSGNSYKIRLLLSYLGIPYTHVPIDIIKGETQTPAFLAMNPAGQIPLLQLGDGRTLAESNAILTFLAEDTPYLPVNHFDRAKALQWMFWEQYRHEPAIAVARFITIYAPERAAELPILREKGNAALSVMEGHLDGRSFFVGNRPSLADIALYAYTHVAGEAEFALSDYPHVSAWCARMAEHPKHILITDVPVS